MPKNTDRPHGQPQSCTHISLENYMERLEREALLEAERLLREQEFEGLSDVSIECDCGCGGRGRCYDGWPPDPDQPNEGDNDKAN